MKQLGLALGLFFSFLLVRSTLNMTAQGPVEVSSPKRIELSEGRSRRLAFLEAQDQTLQLRQQQVELDLEHIGDSVRRVQSRLERQRASLDTLEPEPSAELTEVRVQLLQKKAEMQLEVERIAAERRRFQEEWSTLTGLRPPAR